jgi:hypothetical protein
MVVLDVMVMLSMTVLDGVACSMNTSIPMTIR